MCFPLVFLRLGIDFEFLVQKQPRHWPVTRCVQPNEKRRESIIPIAIAFVNSEAVENLNQEVGETRLVQNDKWDKAHL